MKDLVISKDEKLESRLYYIIDYLHKQNPNSKLELSSVDATGKVGGKLTQLLNGIQFVQISLQEFKELCYEDGQILEAQLKISTDSKLIVLIRVLDGMYVEIEDFNNIIPVDIIGEHKVEED